MEIIELTDKKRDELLKRSELDDTNVTGIVVDIINDVRKRGDEALKHYTEKFDKVKIEDLRVESEQIKKKNFKIDDKVLNALKKASENIKKFHKAQIPEEWSIEVDEGINAGQIIRPLDSVGCYIPGGRAIYPSTILMEKHT